MNAARVMVALMACVFLGTAHCAATARDTEAEEEEGVCDYEGTMYPVGDFRPDACHPCMCKENGQYYCAVVDCFFHSCVDFEYVEDECCSVCPNGPNCQGPDGTIISANETVTMPSDNGEGEQTCTCEMAYPQPILLCKLEFNRLVTS